MSSACLTLRPLSITMVKPLSRGFAVRSGILSRKKFIYGFYRFQSVPEYDCHFAWTGHIRKPIGKAEHFFPMPKQEPDMIHECFLQGNDSMRAGTRVRHYRDERLIRL